MSCMKKSFKVVGACVRTGFPALLESGYLRNISGWNSISENLGKLLRGTLLLEMSARMDVQDSKIDTVVTMVHKQNHTSEKIQAMLQSLFSRMPPQP